MSYLSNRDRARLERDIEEMKKDLAVSQVLTMAPKEVLEIIDHLQAEIEERNDTIDSQNDELEGLREENIKLETELNSIPDNIRALGNFVTPDE